MNSRTRREFLQEVGRGMLVAGIGYGAAMDLELTPAWAEEASDALTFGDFEPLVRLLQDTSPDRLLALLTSKLKEGLELRQLVGAAALANARTFGGEDYIGFHAMMALVPSYEMSAELPAAKQALPVLKVVYRSGNRIHDHGGHASEILQQVSASAAPDSVLREDALREAVRRNDLVEAEKILNSAAQHSADDAFNQVLMAVQDGLEVHRVVMPHRAWELLDLVGKEHAHTLLRQSVHYCAKNDKNPNYSDRFIPLREMLPKLMDQYHLVSKPFGTRIVDDGWVENFSRTVFDSTAPQASEAVAAALAEGISPVSIGEGISLAANQLVLRDPGRIAKWSSAEKPVGSVHGDSIGVHACDAVNALRNMALVANQRNSAACLLLAAYEVATGSHARWDEFSSAKPYPRAENLEKIQAKSAGDLLKALDGAIRENNQGGACAVIAKYAELNESPRPVFDLLLQYAISEDGALHAEKYYRTVSEEFAAARPAFRWRQLVALARVTASEYGRPAPGYAEAKGLLGV